MKVWRLSCWDTSWPMAHGPSFT